MQTQVFVRAGSYRGMEIRDTKFDMVRPIKEGAKGLYITVDGTGHTGLPQKAIRIKLNEPADVELGNGKPKKVRTDKEIMEDLREKFNILDDMGYAAVNGTVRGLIVSGPPGIGKSYGLEQIVQEAWTFAKMADADTKHGVEKGYTTPVHLFMMLYRYRAKGSLLVLDDMDNVLYDEIALNLLKGALDSSRKRFLSWNTDSNVLNASDVPNKFEFEGSVVFLTNLDFTGGRGRIAKHLEAIVSRCHYLDMGITDLRDKLLRCKQIVEDGMLKSYNFEDGEEDEVMAYVFNNAKRLREVSLRMVTKIADLRKMSDQKWQLYASNTCLKK